jgi:hypothetical protein
LQPCSPRSCCSKNIFINEIRSTGFLKKRENFYKIFNPLISDNLWKNRPVLTHETPALPIHADLPLMGTQVFPSEVRFLLPNNNKWADFLPCPKKSITIESCRIISLLYRFSLIQVHFRYSKMYLKTKLFKMNTNRQKGAIFREGCTRRGDTRRSILLL